MKRVISNERRFNLLVGALEGGSNYWYILLPSACSVIDSVQMPNKDTTLCERMWKTIEAGKAIQVHHVDDGDLLGEISLATMPEREKAMGKELPQQFADIISENDDAATADVWFQYMVMGKVVYG